MVAFDQLDERSLVVFGRAKQRGIGSVVHHLGIRCRRAKRYALAKNVPRASALAPSLLHWIVMDDVFAKHFTAPRHPGVTGDVFARHFAPAVPDSRKASRATPPPPLERGRAMAPLAPLAAAAVLLLGAGVGVQALGGATARPNPPAATTTPSLRDSVRIPDLQSEAEELRAITLGAPVTAVRLDRERLGALIKEISERDPDPATSGGADDALHLIGALTRAQSLEQIMTKGLEGQVAGLYDPDTDKLYLIRTKGFDATDSTIVHEIVHALQDHRYDLDTLMKSDPADSDGETAAQSVVEGDATEVQSRWIERAGLAAALAELSGTMGQLAGTSADSLALPQFLQRSLEFPYMSGSEFVKAVRADGGERAVDRAFRHPPRTTLAIMKPELYLRGRDAPEPVAAPPTVPGSRRVFNTTFGAADLWALIGDESLAETWLGGRIVVDRDGARGTMHLALLSSRPRQVAVALRTQLPRTAKVDVEGKLVTATNAGPLG